MSSEHGTRARYNAGCRCQPCTAANTAYGSPSRAGAYRKKARAAAEDLSWHARAVCRTENVPTDVFFAEHTGPALAVCSRCPVARQCHLAAQFHEETAGVWGGKSRAIKRPHGPRADPGMTDDEIAVAVLQLVRNIAEAS